MKRQALSYLWDATKLATCVWLVAAGLLIAGCASSNKVLDESAQAEMRTLAGVDSTVAIESDTLAQRLFVSLEQEEKAKALKDTSQQYVQKSDSLWRYLTMAPGEKQVSPEDSVQGVVRYNEGARALIAYSQLSSEAPVDSSRLLEIRARERQYLDQAQTALERAIVLNPYDLEARNLLAIVYRRQAERLSSEDKFAKAAETLERLVRLDRGQHTLFANLGQLYYTMGKWQPAYDNFKKAEEVLRATSYLNSSADSVDMTEAPVDTAAWFTYSFYEGYAQTNMGHAETALDHLRQALNLARSEQQRRSVKSVIDWINWDDGNIPASETRDDLLKATKAGRYAEAEIGFRELLGRLRTQHARDEIEWRLALVEYQLDKRQQAIARLKRVIDRLALSADRVQSDSLVRWFFEDYGTMAFNLGGWYLKRNRKTSFTYFVQASRVAWSGRAKAYLQLAKFAQNDPGTSIR